MTPPRRPTAANNTAYSYIRFSTPEQAKGDSLRRQTAKAADYCERSGLTLDTRLKMRDLGISAFKGNNATQGALGVFLRAIETGKVAKGSTLIVESLDRLTRNQIEEALELFMGIIRAGVRIVTLTPEQLFEKGKLELTQLVIALVVLSRGHEESAMKAARLSAAWAAKRGRMDKIKLTGRCPAWLKLSADKTEFVVKPAAATTIKRIYAMAIAGHGLETITRTLNREAVDSIARVPRWHRSYVAKILKSRSTFGEFQPHTGGVGHRKPIGEPIPNYYPAIISEQDYYRVQAAMHHRDGRRGRPATKHTNLFTGIAFDANDKSPMVMMYKGQNSRRGLISSAAMRGEKGASPYCSIPMEPFEQLFLAWAVNLTATNMGEDATANKQHELDAATAKLDELDRRVETIKQKIESAGNVDVLLDLLIRHDTDRKSLAEHVEKLRREVAPAAATDHLDQSRQIIHQLYTPAPRQGVLMMLDTVPETERMQLRHRLREAVQGLIDRIDMTAHRTGHTCHITADITMRSGASHLLKAAIHRDNTITDIISVPIPADPDKARKMRAIFQPHMKMKPTPP